MLTMMRARELAKIHICSKCPQLNKCKKCPWMWEKVVEVVGELDEELS